MNIIVNLPITADISIVIISDYNTNLDVMYGYSGELFAALKHGDTFTRLSSKMTLWDLQNILHHLNAALHDTILLPEQINGPRDLGLSYNNYWYQVSSNLDQEFDEWIGAPLKLLEGNGLGLKSNVTFLYNSNQKIEIAITLAYDWFFPIKKIPILYKNWLKKYKVLHQFHISKETLQNWIKTLQPICNQLSKNIDAT